MQRLLILAVLLTAGCQTPLAIPGAHAERVDSPYVSLSEQEARARNRWALPEEARKVAPPSGNEFLGWK